MIIQYFLEIFECNRFMLLWSTILYDRFGFAMLEFTAYLFTNRLQFVSMYEATFVRIEEIEY